MSLDKKALKKVKLEIGFFFSFTDHSYVIHKNSKISTMRIYQLRHPKRSLYIRAGRKNPVRVKEP